MSAKRRVSSALPFPYSGNVQEESVTYSPAQQSSDSRGDLTLSISIHQIEPMTEPVLAVLAGSFADGIGSCDDENSDVTKGVEYNRLAPGLKLSVVADLQSQLNRSSDDQRAYTTVELADIASREHYVLISSKFSTNQNNPKMIVQEVNVTCSIANKNFWTTHGDDDRLDVPATDFGYTAPSNKELRELSATQSVSVFAPDDRDLTLQRANIEPTKSAASGYAATWEPACNSTYGGQDSQVQQCDHLSAVFASSERQQDSQKYLFLSGVCLALIGGLAISVLSTLLGFVQPIIDQVKFDNFSVRRRKEVSPGMDADGDDDPTTQAKD